MSAAFAWIPVAALPIAWVVGYDVWAIKTHHWTLSRQMHDWLFSPTIGPIIAAGVSGGAVWLILHLLRYHGHI